MIFQQRAAAQLSSAAEQATQDLREAAESVGDAASAASRLFAVLAVGVVVALGLAAAAYLRAGE
jgi:hypothetical protein